MHYLRYAVLGCLAMAASAFTPDQARAEWELLGEKAVGFLVDRDVIHVGRREGRFERLLVRVKRNDIEMLDLRVVYGNGEVDDIPVRHFIRDGGETRPLDLRGDRGRSIERIEMTYRSRPSFRGEAVVQVFGDAVSGRRDEGRRYEGRDEGRRDEGRRHEGRDEGRRDEGRRYEGRDEPRAESRRSYEWELLGKRRVGFLVDRDVIDVGRREGKFRKLKLRVNDNDVHFYDLKVVYGNGEVDDISVREKIRAGGETRALDLSGRDRFIRRIELVYSSKPSFRGEAQIEVWGLQAD